MSDRLPLSALLSQALVAFTLEFDNEFEHLVPHRTTNYGGGSRSAPWLVSMAMWLHLMQFVPGEGIPAKQLYRLTRLSPKAFRMLLVRMSKWWGYLTVSEMFVRPTAGGLKALEVWRPLAGVIEKRWSKRFSPELMDQLRDALESMAQSTAGGYPDYLPVLGFELLSQIPAVKPGSSALTSSRSDSLPVLLAKSLLAFAMEFEHDSALSLAVCANALRLAGNDGVRVRDLPRLSGVSKEAMTMVSRRAQQYGLGVVQNESGGRSKTFVLTANGQRASETYRELTWKIEKRWKTRFGSESVEKLRSSLERLVGASDPSPLLEGLKPYPDGWRAQLPPLERLPHYPMVLHRGGFPDGS